jgi:ABC-type enterochelin transport system permease subunit
MALEIGALVFIVIVALSAALVLSRLLDGAVALSYGLAQKAWLRKEKRGWRVLFLAAILLAIATTVIGFWGNLGHA